MTERQSGHRKKASNEDDRAPAVCGQFSNGLQHIAGVSHIAYCVGPFQLAFLLSALQVSGIMPASCMILPYAVIFGVSNDDLLKNLLLVCGHLGMKTVDASLSPSPTLKEAHSLLRNEEHSHRSPFWYCKGGLWPLSVLSHLRKVLPDIVLEYYDGLGSHIAEFEQEKRHLSFLDAHGFGGLRQLAIQRLMRPDRYFMPDDGLWEKYAPKEVQNRTHYVPLKVTQEKIRLVGQMLDEIDGGKPLEDGPGAVLLTGMFSEWRKSILLVDELNMYAEILEIIRSMSRTTSILVKTHPRTSPEKIQRLGDISARYNARLHTRQQLVEYMLDKSGRRDVVVIGPPSTALLSTIQFGYGSAFCLGKRFIESYLGSHGHDEHLLASIDLLSKAEVTVVDSLADLSELLREQVPR